MVNGKFFDVDTHVQEHPMGQHRAIYHLPFIIYHLPFTITKDIHVLQRRH